MPTVHVKTSTHVLRDSTTFAIIDAVTSLLDETARELFPNASHIVVRDDIWELHMSPDDVIEEEHARDPYAKVSHFIDDVIGATHTLTLNVDVSAETVAATLNAHRVPLHAGAVGMHGHFVFEPTTAQSQ